MLNFEFCGATLTALPSGALYWERAGLLVVSDLHLGKSARLSAVGGAPLPPYDTRETLLRLETDMEKLAARHVLCLGDSFDAPGLDRALPEDEQLWINRLQAGVDWTWIEGNHDPGPVSLGGTHRSALEVQGLTFRHIASAQGSAEISGHYHPKARISTRGRSRSRPCFLMGQSRLILPAYGAYTGGLATRSPVYDPIVGTDAQIILTGAQMALLPREM